MLFSRCRQKSPQPLFNSVLAAGPFWGLSTHGDFPLRFSLPPTQLVISPGPSRPSLSPPLPLMEWLGLDPLIVISGSFFFFFHPACIGQGSLYLPAPLHNVLWQNGGRRIGILIPLFSQLPAVKKKSVASGWLLSGGPKACEIIHARRGENNSAKGGDGEIFCFFTS